MVPFGKAAAFSLYHYGDGHLHKHTRKRDGRDTAEFCAVVTSEDQRYTHTADNAGFNPTLGLGILCPYFHLNNVYSMTKSTTLF